MLTYEELVSVISESTAITSSRTVVRELELELSENLFDKKPIKVITGIRRAGKSFILKRIYQKLTDRIPKKNILFLNFENDRLSNYLSITSLRNLYDLFLANSDRSHRLYLFFDEIQLLEGWEKFVRTNYDSTDNEIYITGSNSSLLSGELSTALGGRVLQYRLHPFSFNEYLKYQKLDADDIFSIQEKRDNINRLFNNYIKSGGICETFNLSDKQKISYRESLVEKIILKDIVSRHGINKPEFLNRFYLYLARNIGSIISYAAISRETGIDDKTVSLYIQYLEDSFIFDKVGKLEWKSKRIFNTQKKFYTADPIFLADTIDSRKLENLVFNHLAEKHGTKNILFMKNEKDHEIDFIVKNDKGFDCYQVCYSLNDKNMKRELRSLEYLIKKSKPDSTDNYIMLYMYDERTDRVGHESIQFRQIVEFLLLR